MTLIGDAGAMSQRQLGELLNLNRTTTGKLVDALESKGWLVRAVTRTTGAPTPYVSPTRGGARSPACTAHSTVVRRNSHRR